MQDGIKISELREMANKIFDEFEQMGCSEFVLNEDFYWDIHENERYDLKREPEGCAVGQLFDDIYFLRKCWRVRRRFALLCLSIWLQFLDTWLCMLGFLKVDHEVM